MTSQASFTTSTPPPGSKHGFFKTFPRELRDQIYDLLYEEDEEDGVVFMWATNPLVALRLINRQFRLEYDERCNKNEYMSQLLFQDIAAYTFPQFPNRLAFSPHITNITVALRACGLSDPQDHPCIAQDDLAHCSKWMGDLIKQFPRLRWIRVYLTLPYNKCLNGALQSLYHLTGLRKMLEVEVWRARCKDFEGGQYLATWTKEDGLELDEEAAQLCDEQMLAEQ